MNTLSGEFSNIMNTSSRGSLSRDGTMRLAEFRVSIALKISG